MPDDVSLEGSVQAEGPRFRVEDSETVRADDPHAVTPCPEYKRVFLEFGGGTDFAHAGREDDRAADSRCTAVVDYLSHVLGRHCHDGEVDRAGDVGDGGVSRNPAHRGCIGVHDEDLAGEPTVENVAEDLVADAARSAAGTDHDDGARRGHPLHRRMLGTAFAAFDAREGNGGIGDGERDRDDAGTGCERELEARIEEHANHRGVRVCVRAGSGESVFAGIEPGPDRRVGRTTPCELRTTAL